MNLNRRAFIGAGTALAASLYLPGIARATTPPHVRVGYAVPETALFEQPFKVNWVVTANMLGMQGLEPLVRLGGENHLDYVLAEDISPDDTGKVWTIKLRPGIRWVKRGDPLTAAHVADNLRRWMDDEDSGPGSTLRREVADMEQVDDLTLKLHLKVVDFYLLYTFTHYAAFILHPADNGQFGPGADTTGPYVGTEYRVGDVALLEPNPNYWRTDDVAALPMRILPDDAYGYDGYDFIPSISPGTAPAVLRQAGLELKGNRKADALVLHMRCQEAPFDDAEIRKALRLAIDPQKVVDALAGYARVANHTHIADIQDDYPPDWKPQVTYQPQAAMTLLKGRVITANVNYLAGNAWQEAVARSICEQAAAVGFVLTPTPIGEDDMNDNWGKHPGITLTKWSHRALGSQTWNLAYRSDSGPGWNPFGWGNARFDAILDLLAMLHPVHRDVRHTLAAEAMNILAEDGPMLQPVWLNCEKAYKGNLLLPNSVQVGSGDHPYLNRLRMVA